MTFLFKRSQINDKLFAQAALTQAELSPIRLI